MHKDKHVQTIWGPESPCKLKVDPKLLNLCGVKCSISAYANVNSGGPFWLAQVTLLPAFFLWVRVAADMFCKYEPEWGRKVVSVLFGNPSWQYVADCCHAVFQWTSMNRGLKKNKDSNAVHKWVVQDLLILLAALHAQTPNVGSLLAVNMTSWVVLFLIPG